MKSSHPEAVAASRVNPGETLRKMRESKNLALGDVAEQLNLTAQALRNLESGAFELLPGHTFARGYVRSYARLMGMDPNRLVVDFDQYTGTDATGSSVASLARIEEPARVSQSLLKGFSIVALVALGAVGFFWWQGQSEHLSASVPDVNLEHVEVEAADGTTEIHPLTEPEDQAVADAQVDTLAESDTGSPMAAEEAAPEAGVEAAVPQVAQTPTASETGGAPAASTPLVTPSPPVLAAGASLAEAPVAVPAAGEVQVSLQFSADCWVRLVDADGKTLLSGLKRNGDSVKLNGKAPLALRLGYARGAVVQVNGRPIDIAPFTRGETADLELGQ